MAWGRSASTPPPPPPPKSWTSLIPLILLLLVLLTLSFIGYQVFLITQSVTTATEAKLQKKNVVLTKDGVKVGVKEKTDEELRDKVQRGVVGAWNLSSWPEYRSRLGWGQDGARDERERK